MCNESAHVGNVLSYRAVNSQWRIDTWHKSQKLMMALQNKLSFGWLDPGNYTVFFVFCYWNTIPFSLVTKQNQPNAVMLSLCMCIYLSVLLSVLSLAGWLFCPPSFTRGKSWLYVAKVSTQNLKRKCSDSFTVVVSILTYMFVLCSGIRLFGLTTQTFPH